MRFWNSLLPIKGSPLVSVVVVAYHRVEPLRCLLSSYRCQTYHKFEIIVYHDGPGPEIKALVESFNDRRFKYFETKERLNDFGHSLREMGSQIATGEYIGHSNDDNYYCPVFFETMLSAMVKKNAGMAYCNMVHSHNGWSLFETAPAVGQIDAGGWLCRSDVVKSTPWRDKTFAGDGVFATDLAYRTRAVKVNNILFVHN